MTGIILPLTIILHIVSCYAVTSMDNTISDTEYGIAKYLNNNVHCQCLRDLTRQLEGMPRIATCAHCGKEVEIEAILVCSRCKGTNYCSKDCQRGNWTLHKNGCKLKVWAGLKF